MASAPACGEQLLALVERGQAERRNVRLEMPHRVRVEGGDDHRPPHVEAERDRAVHHRLVAEVKAVEIAEREDGAAELVGDGLVVEQPLHWAPPLSASEAHPQIRWKCRILAAIGVAAMVMVRRKRVAKAPRYCEHWRTFVSGSLDFAPLTFLSRAHPDPPVPGGAFVRASVFRLELGLI